MTAAERTRLARVLGMLGSAHDGERAAAGLLATRILKSAGLSWADVIGCGNSTGPAPSDQPSQRAHAVAVCSQFWANATEWETQFLAGIRRRRTLTERQLATLLNIAAELPDRGEP